MKPCVCSVALLAALLILTQPAAADPIPMGEVVPVNTVVLSDSPFDLIRPNVFDPFHPKVLWFSGIARVSDDQFTAGNTLTIVFDWLNLEGQVEFSDPLVIFVPLNDPQPIDFHHQIPFCPQQVSLHMSVNGPAPVTVIGEFMHVCIPEPSSMVLMGLGAAGFAGLGCRGLRRRRAQAAT